MGSKIYPGFVGVRVNSQNIGTTQDNDEPLKDSTYYEGVITRLFTPLIKDNITDFPWLKIQRTLGAIILEIKASGKTERKPNTELKSC